jgi:peptide/nickel transport system permease protein/glutathione transport system permease protein
MFAVFFVVINLVTDLLTQWLDPRTREQERPA